MTRLKLKIQLYCGDEIAMGPGKADLLEAIARESSISAAARSMGMSYRRGWLLVDAMNRCFAEPLIDTTPGGGKGAGASVTDAGRAVLASYKALVTGLEATASGKHFNDIEARLRGAPLPPKS